MTTFLLASQCSEDCLPWREGRVTAEVEKDAEACCFEEFFSGDISLSQNASSRRKLLILLASSRDLRASNTLPCGARLMKNARERGRESRRTRERAADDGYLICFALSRAAAAAAAFGSISGALGRHRKEAVPLLTASMAIGSERGRRRREKETKEGKSDHPLFFPSSIFFRRLFFKFRLLRASLFRERRRKARSFSLSLLTFSIRLSLSLGGRESNSEGDTNHAASPLHAGLLVERSCCCEDHFSSSKRRSGIA